MARPREFDEDDVLERAARAFWEHGYEATSVADLERATGLAKGSLYKAFEGKHALFMRALDRYLCAGRDTLAHRLVSAPSGAEGLAGWLRGTGHMATDSGVRRGCFGVNSVVERGPADPAVRERVGRHEREVQRLYAAAIERGIAEGSFPSGPRARPGGPVHQWGGQRPAGDGQGRPQASRRREHGAAGPPKSGLNPRRFNLFSKERESPRAS